MKHSNVKECCSPLVHMPYDIHFDYMITCVIPQDSYLIQSAGWTRIT